MSRGVIFLKGVREKRVQDDSARFVEKTSSESNIRWSTVTSLRRWGHNEGWELEEAGNENRGRNCGATREKGSDCLTLFVERRVVAPAVLVMKGCQGG